MTNLVLYYGYCKNKTGILYKQPNLVFTEAWGDSNPCFSSQALTGDERNVTLVQEFDYKCDDCLEKGWYRFISSNGTLMKMATQWVSVNRSSKICVQNILKADGLGPGYSSGFD